MVFNLGKFGGGTDDSSNSSLTFRLLLNTPNYCIAHPIAHLQSMAGSEKTTVLPGQVVGEKDLNAVGVGTHIQDSRLLASVAGPLQSTSSVKKGSNLPNVSISRIGGSLLPEVGTIVMGKITRTNPRQANISILALGFSGEHVCRDAFPGLIRQQDIRATEIDKVKVTESFRVGDIVRAVVISLGDERSYYLSTAKNELGVVLATSEWGNQMYPISWKEFQDPESGVNELRKVAKPI